MLPLVLELSEEELDELVEQATVDAYNDDEPKGAEWIAAYRHWARHA